MPALTPLSEASKTVTVLAEVVAQEGLYPKLTLYPSLTQYPKPRIPPTLAALTEA